MATFGVTSNGFVIKRLADVQASLRAKLQAVRDAQGNAISVDAEDSTLISQLMGIMAEEIAEGWSMAGALANQFDPLYNIGAFQSGVVQLNGLARAASIPTEIQVTLTGVAGTAIPSGSGLSYNGSAFNVINPVTIGAAGIAAGTVTIATNPADGATCTIGGVTYTFKNTLNAAFQVKIGTNNYITALYLYQAIGAVFGGAGSTYGTGTYANPLVTAVYAGGTATLVTVTALTFGVAGNAIGLATSTANITLSGATLAGGTDYGTVSGLAIATAKTPVAVPDASVLSITTPVNGWISALCASTLVAGTAEESDEALRIRQQMSTQSTAARESEAILAAVLGVPAVTWAQVYENPSATTTDANGIPPASICIMVIGGATADIVAAVYPKLACNTNTHGDGINSGTVNGLEIDFYRPTSTAITVAVNVRPTGATLPAGYATTIKNAITAWGNANYTPGQKVYASDLYQALAGQLTGMYITSLTVGGGTSYAMAFGHAALFSADNVTVTNT